MIPLSVISSLDVELRGVTMDREGTVETIEEKVAGG